MHATLHPPRRPGFTLTEVLISLAIFALGSVAVASIFPSAILIQKRTIQDVEAETFEATVRAELLGRGFEETALLAGTGVRDRVITPRTAAVQTTTGARWSLRQRSYGSLSELATDREMFWKPLFYDANAETPGGTGSATSPDARDWSVFVFIVRPSTLGEYPKGSFATGDLALESPADPEEVPAVARINAKVQLANADGKDHSPSAADPVPVRFFLDGFPNSAAGGPLVRPGDKVLIGPRVTPPAGTRGATILQVIGAEDGRVEVVGPLPGYADGDDVDLWYAHPGTARETSFVELFELNDADGPTDFLVH